MQWQPLQVLCSAAYFSKSNTIRADRYQMIVLLGLLNSKKDGDRLTLKRKRCGSYRPKNEASQDMSINVALELSPGLLLLTVNGRSPTFTLLIGESWRLLLGKPPTVFWSKSLLQHWSHMSKTLMNFDKCGQCTFWICCCFFDHDDRFGCQIRIRRM